MVAKPASTKSSTSAAPESRNSHGSPPAPVPVTFAAPTRIPAAVRPWTRAATVVVLPEFIDVPATTMVTGAGRADAPRGRRAPSATLRRQPDPSASSPTGCSVVAGFIFACWLSTREATPPAATRWHSPSSVGISDSNWSGA